MEIEVLVSQLAFTGTHGGGAPLTAAWKWEFWLSAKPALKTPWMGGTEGLFLLLTCRHGVGGGVTLLSGQGERPDSLPVLL